MELSLLLYLKYNYRIERPRIFQMLSFGAPSRISAFFPVREAGPAAVVPHKRRMELPLLINLTYYHCSFS